ncbi:related to GCN3-translation initiation factor 34 alpha subunit, putative [Babesia ovata]|uniref:Related to GCN3-translation initiation factor 34 alpha subunit, putative n=1 Tax=Babesia ovata TaxID=189622 RepID=A0A2H6KIR0_9APIC|nr:related to GCN3-translation initiation factor 34 alpha subunit, putative [Babesia ovata]GBE62869.1 related to GCN3-translation initiation factor 34 alpha subunit, putative [Babesia ovata]
MREIMIQNFENRQKYLRAFFAVRRHPAGPRVDEHAALKRPVVCGDVHRSQFLLKLVRCLRHAVEYRSCDFGEFLRSQGSDCLGEFIEHFGKSAVETFPPADVLQQLL